MKSSSVLFAAFLSASLAACGGGGSPSAPDNSAALSQALQHISVPGVSTTPAPAFAGTYVSLVYADGTKQALGYVEGSTEQVVASKVAQAIVASPGGANAKAYKELLSDAGLKISLMGQQTGKSAITGLALYAPDSVYVAKLTTTGIIIHSA